MTLEDHVGDIIRKARQMMNVSLATAAQSAGLTTQQMADLEANGTSSKHPDYSAVAKLLGLAGERLGKIASGWLPQVPDLSQWRELRQITTSESGMGVHCYLVWDEISKEAALFDTGFDPAPVFRLLDENGLQLKHVFVTHSHPDHTAGLNDISRKYPRALLHTSSRNALPQQRNRSNDFIHLGNLRITNRDTPGHAADGTAYIIGNWPEDAPHVVVVGDALFAGSMGGAGSNGELAKSKVRQQILSLPPATLICPGHGPLTTVAQEKENNPFFG